MCNFGGYTKNVNLFWASVTGLAVWFLFWHTPIFWKQRQILKIHDLLLAIHIVTAGTIYMACAHNCLVTPSLSSSARFLHTWVGRIGLVSGVVSFSLGAYLAWSRLNSDPTVVGGTTLGFAIPITIGGVLQIYCEVKGFRAIREYKRIREELGGLIGENDGTSVDELKTRMQEKQHTALGNHIGYMLNLFVMACSIPAGIRLASWISGQEDGILTTVAIFAIIFSLSAVATRYVDRMLPQKSPEEEQTGLANATSYGGVRGS